VSGPEQAFERVQPYFEPIAPTVVHAGTGEESRLVKLCHNLLLGMITQSLVEVTALAEKGGVRNAAFLEFINGSGEGLTLLATLLEPTSTEQAGVLTISLAELYDWANHRRRNDFLPCRG
jgi:3-hydroxyisobutyrate dehydrogenase-like beta-hydroxyacid dehydrogenase